MQIQTSKLKTTAIKHACSSSEFAASVSESYLSMSKLCLLVSLSYRCFLSQHEKMKKTIFTFLICLCFFTERSLADPRTTLAGTICSNKSTTTSPARENFRANFLQAMESLTPLVDRQGYAAVVNGTSMTVYGYGECMKDLDQNDCNLCFAQSRTEIMKCLPFQLANRGGRVFYDGCYIRYDDYNFFNESLGALDRTVCATNDYDGRNATVFSENAVMLVKNLSEQALNNDGFSVGYVDRGNVTVHGLVQCWEMVKGSACERCLNDAVSKVSNCTPKEEGRVLNAGCYLRYSPQRFYNNSDPDAAVGGGNNHLAAILGVIFSTLALAMIVSAVAIVYRRRNREKQRVRKELGALLRTVNKSKLNFSYESLEQATNYFNHSNKLGQGGSGSVYKGKLSDGRIVAVKRLHFITKQWIDHFFNEVNLISGIEHKNLVKLLGCSVTGPESLLVYEYLPNQSLYDYLFVKKNPVPWRARYNIVLGTAEGLAYLHEELHVRIIHRDIKLGNILLAEDLTAKIADFGLARLFPEDKTHLSTAIAGTLGYMAPEYIVRGKLTEKVDVYSFGVLLIEVVSGKRNSTFFQESRSILQKTWNLYVNGRLLEAVDPILNNQFPEEEAIHLLQIGLLCVQASPELRPSMSTIVKMLTDNREIPQPNQPPFLKYSSGESSQSTQSSTSANVDTQPATYSNTEINRMHQLE